MHRICLLLENFDEIDTAFDAQYSVGKQIKTFVNCELQALRSGNAKYTEANTYAIKQFKIPIYDLTSANKPVICHATITLHCDNNALESSWQTGTLQFANMPFLREYKLMWREKQKSKIAKLYYCNND